MAGKHNPRSANWSIKLSYDYFIHDDKGNIVNQMTEQQWKDYIRLFFKGFVDKGEICFIVFIFHDQDSDKSGNVTGIHVHAILNVQGGKEKSVIMKMFGITREKDVDYLKNKASAYQYLLHITQSALKDKKHIYNFCDIEVFSNDPKFELMKKFYPTKKDSNIGDLKDQLHVSVITGEMTVNDVRSEYMKNDDLGMSRWASERNQYIGDEKEWMNACNDWYTTHNSCKTMIYVRGGGGSQKTDLAQMVIAPHYADKRGVHVPAAPMGKVTFDPIGTYKGEKVTVLNEMKGSSWILEGFCECLDPTHSGTTGSRYFDRPFYPEYVIMTTSTSIEDFLKDMFLKWVNVGRNNPSDKYHLIYEPSTKQVTGLWSNGTNYTPSESIPYSEDTESIWDKVWQVRRRLPILVTLENGMASIDILEYSKKTYTIGELGKNSYKHFDDVAYSLTDESVKANFLQTLDAAIKNYYYINKFTVTPRTVKKPVIII